MELNYNNVVYSTNVNELYKLHNTSKLEYDYKAEPIRVITNLEFNKVYYMIYENKLVAFKLIAISVIMGGYLVETPFGVKLVGLRGIKVFYTKAEYFKYLENQCEPIIFDLITPQLLKLPSFSKHRVYEYKVVLNNSYKWDKYSGKPMQQTSKIFDVLYTENGFIVYYKLYDDKSYKTYQECLQANLDGMEICDFGEEETTITIEVKTEVKPKIHTLRFIEE